MKGLKTILLFFTCLCVISCNNSGETASSTDNTTEANAIEATSEEVIDDRGYIVNVGETAPDFDIEYLDGTVTKLSDLKGKLVMIQFTASWCSVCRKEMPYIESDIWQKHKNNPNFVLIGIDLKEDKDVTAKFAKDMNITYPLTLDLDGSKFELFTAPKAGVTRNIIVDKNGKIVLLTRLFEMEEFNEMVHFIDNYMESNF